MGITLGINMIEDFKELNFSEKDKIEDVDNLIKEKLGHSFLEMKEMISSYVKEKCEEISLDMINIIPYGQYDKIIDDNDNMAIFLKEEASKVENWEIYSFMQNSTNQNLIQFIFNNKSVDDGDTLRGHVFISKSGVIRHVFAETV